MYKHSHLSHGIIRQVLHIWRLFHQQDLDIENVNAPQIFLQDVLLQGYVEIDYV